MDKAFCMIMVLLSIVGCASTERFMQNLRPLKSENYVLFKEDVFYLDKRGIASAEWKEGLRKGVYRPEFENEYGTFFRGPDSCVFQFINGKIYGQYNGGVWVPKDRINNKPMIYYYFNYNQASANYSGPVVSGILSAYKGDITFIPVYPPGTFLESIQVTNLPLDRSAVKSI